MNKVHLTGIVCSGPKIEGIDYGIETVKFLLATRKKGIKRYNGMQILAETDFHNMIAWNETAHKASEQIIKGSNITVEGEINYREYMDENRQKHYITEINIISFSVFEGENIAIPEPPSSAIEQVETEYLSYINRVEESTF